MNQKYSCFFWVKLRPVNTQKLKLGIQNVQIEIPIIGYVSIFNDPLAQPHGKNLDPIWASNFFFLFFNFYLILQEFCDFSGTWNLHYLIFLRMQFFKNFWFSAKFLVFRQLNWTQKWTKTINFQCIPFEPNFKILNDFSSNVFVLLDQLWSSFSDTSCKLQDAS